MQRLTAREHHYISRALELTSKKYKHDATVVEDKDLKETLEAQAEECDNLAEYLRDAVSIYVVE